MFTNMVRLRITEFTVYSLQFTVYSLKFKV